jgi:hypothetical protein
VSLAPLSSWANIASPRTPRSSPRSGHDVAERVLLGLVADAAVLDHERAAAALERAVDPLRAGHNFVVAATMRARPPVATIAVNSTSSKGPR